MSLHGELLHHHLRGYKDDKLPAVRSRMSARLAALLAVFLRFHTACVGDFDSVVLVPSGRRAALQAILDRLPGLRDRGLPALRFRRSDIQFSPDRFSLMRGVQGERILLLDDTFTAGGSMFSAAAALRAGGGIVVTQLVLGRHVRPNWPPTQEMLEWLKGRPWDEARCARCSGEVHGDPVLPF